MSILIKGMEMPKDCWHCRLADPIEGGCLVDQKMHGDWDEPDNCPLFPVPPHGDLIERDALMDQIVHDTPLSAVFEKTMRRYLNNAPTIIPAEEEDNDRT